MDEWIKKMWLDVVEHACNPKYLGVGERRTGSSRPGQAKFIRPYLK
jgi:hypothetical protein